ncbi:hypothetical protein GUITHDRAFT_153079 [Guillardia theta CCMP2712]|uniref:Uncharacterized protein n=1 Tax=Guillardia theta (strain CCMP2712) TaxID=905079 RepID=L1J6J8_GUITC|nr:hypothetical protein GUITHDRAFT_153079 [Guillardia theta CCMP2712]EKX44168.1 hypothetical protein GUITHDRAFT_153079 [Guillardia theta CCMP2712]|eukprot:XP_005831148.1 hypothetical protein GUITHDRAFT_153079 [Guillardia theta CCMP2712]
MGNSLEGAATKSEDKEETGGGMQAMRAFTCCCAPSSTRKFTVKGIESKPTSSSSDLWGSSRRGLDVSRVPQTDGWKQTYVGEGTRGWLAKT